VPFTSRHRASGLGEFDKTFFGGLEIDSEADYYVENFSVCWTALYEDMVFQCVPRRGSLERLRPAAYGYSQSRLKLGDLMSPFDFERIPTVDTADLVNGDRILFGPVKRPLLAVKLPADFVLVEIVLGDEFRLIGYRIDALPTGSPALQLTLWWRGVRPATED